MFLKFFNGPRKGLLWRCCLLFLALIFGTLITLMFLEYHDNKLFSAFASGLHNGNINQRIDNDSVNLESRKVVIGAVSCRNISDNSSMKYSEATVVMLKSVLISTKLYNISTVELHLFLEHKQDEEYFRENLQEMGYPADDPRLKMFTHSAVDMVPKNHRDHMIYHPRYRCGYTRFFFPSALPHVDSIIHLDSDMIITGNLWIIWNLFDAFDQDQLVGAARSTEANDTNNIGMYKRWFGDIPHPPPRGINAGLLLMNLTRMREYQWEERLISVYEDYSKDVTLSGQRTVSILMALDLKILKMLSCQYNFCHRHCDKGFTCWDAIRKGDEGNVHLIHGNGFKFEKDKIFHQIYQAYMKLNLTAIRSDHGNGLVTDLKTNLMIPIRNSYDKKSASCTCSKCFGTLDRILFRDFFNDTAFV